MDRKQKRPWSENKTAMELNDNNFKLMIKSAVE